MEPILLYLFFVMLIANAAESMVGFGSTVITLTFGSFFFSMDQLLVVIVPLNLILSSWTCLKYRKDIHWNVFFKNILPYCLLGMPFGIILFDYLQDQSLKLIYGIIIAALGLKGLWQLLNRFESAPPHSKYRWLGRLYLFLGGFMQGLYASGGPFVVLYAQTIKLHKRQFRTTLSFLWFVLNVILTTKFIFSDQVTLETLSFSVKLLPAILLGMVLGFKLHQHVTERTFAISVYALLTLAGLSRVIQSL